MNNEEKDGFYKSLILDDVRKIRSKVEPFPHQKKSLEELYKWYRNKNYKTKGGILVLPTGAGKTFTAVRFLCQYPISDGYKILWLAHKHDLLEQAFYEFYPKEDEERKRKGIQIGLISEPMVDLEIMVASGSTQHRKLSDIRKSTDIVIATLYTIYNGLQRGNIALDDFLRGAGEKLFVVFDEAHHSPANTFRAVIEKLRDKNPEMILLGLTATPTYHDEKKKGFLSKLFPQLIIHQENINNLIAQDILAKPEFEEQQTKIPIELTDKELNELETSFGDLPPSVIAKIASNKDRNRMICDVYQKNAKRYGRTIIFADSIVQCEALLELLKKDKVRSDAVYSYIEGRWGTPEERNARPRNANELALDSFRKGELDVLINVNMLTEGTDVPLVQTVFLTRQTTSQIRLTQMVGRALRGKKCGGTDTAYIVSFIDDWKDLIQFAEYSLIEEGYVDTEGKKRERTPWILISIDAIRKAARIIDGTATTESLPFNSILPIGWYDVQYDTICFEKKSGKLSEDDLGTNNTIQDIASNSEDIEPRDEFVLVFEQEKADYERLIEVIMKTDSSNLTKLGALDAVLSENELLIHKWLDEYFRHRDCHIGDDLSQSIFRIARHIGQGNGMPTFFPLEVRKNHNMEEIVTQILSERLTDEQKMNRLKTEFERSDRYWKKIFVNLKGFVKLFFMYQADALLDEPSINSEISLSIEREIEPRDDREPSEEVKKLIKQRDGHICLCCGETSKRLLTIDHIISDYHGGNLNEDNLQTLCKKCNGEKSYQNMDFRRHTADENTKYIPLKFTYFPSLDDEKEISKYLRRKVNLFYHSAAVSSIEHDMHSNMWIIVLYKGNDESLIKDEMKRLNMHIKELCVSKRRNVFSVKVQRIKRNSSSMDWWQRK